VDSVGIRELRDGLSRYLAQVRAGRTVTDHGRPVARSPGRPDRPVDEPLTADAHDRALAGLESVWAQTDVLDVDDDLVRAAGVLARDHGLRGYDAVHCAAALRVTSGTTVALAGDRDLLAAWQREGLQVLDTQS
jgi:antitoxin (DNA-binding transcriptional repressor) of toxin-antitoxin stability system